MQQQPAPGSYLEKLQRMLTGGLLGPAPSYGGLLGGEDQQAMQRQALLAMGAQMLQAGGPSATPVSFGQALGQGMQAGQQAQRQSGEDMLQTMLLKTKLQKGTTQPSDVRSYEYAKQNGYTGSFEDWKRVSAAQPQDPSAIREYDFFSKLTPEQQKQFIDLKRNTQPFQMVETARGQELLNRSTGSLTGVTTRDQEAAAAAQMAGAQAGAQTTGKATAEAKLDLPRLEQNASQALQTIQQLKSHPGLPYITGVYSLSPIVPGTPQAGADALAKQIQGKTFLEAFNTLKGGGQITEVEGSKAEAAIARLQRSQNRREYIQALGELESVLNVGLERARTKAGAAPFSNVKRVRVDANGDAL